MPRLQIRLESPLLHGFPSRGGKNRRSTEHVEILDIAVAPDECFQHHRALNLHLLGQQGIIGFHWAREQLRGAGVNPDAPVASATPVESDDGWVEEACAGVNGVLRLQSTFTELVPGWMVRCSSPATTSTSSGGSTARLVTTGARAGAGVGSAAGGGVRGFALTGLQRLA